MHSAIPVLSLFLFRFESVRPEYWNNSFSESVEGTSYFRFVDVATGDLTPPFAFNHSLGCAMVVGDEGGDDTARSSSASSVVYVYGTTADSSGGGGAVDVFWSSDNMQTWKSKQAVDFGSQGKHVFNTSVEKGKLGGKDIYLMAFEMSSPTTPGGWNTFFATAPTAKGPWTVLDTGKYHMPLDVEHADPAIRYIPDDVGQQGWWYSIPARKTPATTPNNGWYFFQEIARSRDLLDWVNSPGMGLKDAVGNPLLLPNSTLDQTIAPVLPSEGAVAPQHGITPEMYRLLNKMRPFWSLVDDVNTSDMDLCEFNNQTVMYYAVGEQHYDNTLALAVADMPLKDFLEGFFPAAL